MSQTSDDSIEVIWHRHPQVWVLGVLALLCALSTVWALANRAALRNEVQESRAIAAEANRKMVDALKDNAREASQYAKEMSDRSDALRILDKRVVELETELTAEQVRYRAMAQVAENETALRKSTETELGAEQTRYRAAVQVIENESTARKKAEEQLTAIPRNVPSATSVPPSFHVRPQRISNSSMLDIRSCRQQVAYSLTDAGVSAVQMTGNYTVYGSLDSYRIAVLCLVSERTVVVFTVGPNSGTAAVYGDRVFQALSRRL